jgi:ring-1,2-phenylacetyl-CoA epoxidase subunit PaaC
LTIALPDNLKPALADLLLSIADDKLMLGHRNSDWTGLGPILEEDIAFSSLAQDDIAHAQALYEVAGGLLGRTPDQLAFGRTPADYRCADIVTLDDGFDWAVAIARRFLCNHLDLLRLGRLARSNLADLAGLAGRLVAEQSLHVEHSDAWIRRLGRAGGEARDRLQHAFASLAPHAGMLFEPAAREHDLEAAGVYPGDRGVMFDAFLAAVDAVLRDAGLRLDVHLPPPDRVGGRRGVHAESLAQALDEMCEVFRSDPGASW